MKLITFILLLIAANAFGQNQQTLLTSLNKYSSGKFPDNVQKQSQYVFSISGENLKVSYLQSGKKCFASIPLKDVKSMYVDRYDSATIQTNSRSIKSSCEKTYKNEFIFGFRFYNHRDVYGLDIEEMLGNYIKQNYYRYNNWSE